MDRKSKGSLYAYHLRINRQLRAAQERAFALLHRLDTADETIAYLAAELERVEAEVDRRKQERLAKGHRS